MSGFRGRELSVANIEQPLQLANRCWVILDMQVDEPIVQAEIASAVPTTSTAADSRPRASPPAPWPAEIA